MGRDIGDELGCESLFPYVSSSLQIADPLLSQRDRGVDALPAPSYLHLRFHYLAIKLTARSHLRLLIWDPCQHLIVSFSLGLLGIADSCLVIALLLGVSFHVVRHQFLE